MELDQIIFKQLYRFVRRLRRPKADPELERRTAVLADLKPRLTILARALTGEAVELVTAEREGGWSGRALFLPAVYHHAATLDDNIDFYIFRTCYLTVQRRLKLNRRNGDPGDIAPARRQAAETAPLVLAELHRLYPSLQPLTEKLIAVETARQTVIAPEQPDLSMLWGRWMSPAEAPAGLVDMPSQDTPTAEPTAPTTERQAPAREEATTLTVDRKEIQDYTLMHNFEKVETIEEFKGNWRDLDGADDMDEHGESLDELDLRETVRVDTPTHSVYQTEWFRNSAAPESREANEEAPHRTYDEWDASRKAYKRDYCRVYTTAQTADNPAYAADTLRSHRTIVHRLHRRLARVYTEQDIVKRRTTGEEPDLDEVVNTFSDLRAGRTPSEAVYLSRRRLRRDVAVLILMDLSLSTDSYTGGRRILDVEKQSVLLFGEALASFGDRFRIDGFFSRTRNHCRYLAIKSFDDTWDRGRRRLGAVEPQGYTRIGPALRHATHLLSDEPARRRSILLLSDGKPNDYDRYEGGYGVADVRQALREAARQRIHVHALAVESEARFYLPTMFGQGGYRILSHPTDLPEALTELYAALIR